MAYSDHPAFSGLNGQNPADLFADLPTPCYIIDQAQLEKNAALLAGVAERTGCRILLAQKAFSNFAFYPLLARYLAGTEASGLFEARLGAEEMPGREVHVFSAAYRADQFDQLLRYADHIVFNSPAQLAQFGPAARAAGKSIGIRINPECSTQQGHGIYDPCAPGSRLGTTRAAWDAAMTPDLVALLDGLHFHTLCEQDADALAETVRALKIRFGDVLPRMKWLNMGGGHHITRPGYDLALLEEILKDMHARWGIQIYLEPGEAVALNAGYALTRVLDVVTNRDTRIAIMDISAACHMPDVIEMPYTPPLWHAVPVSTAASAGSEETEESSGHSGFSGSAPSAASAETAPPSQSPDGPGYGTGDARRDGCPAVRYRLAGPTCLAGDVIGDYDLQQPLSAGDLLLFGDMAIYTTCKNNTFNGMPLPDIWRYAPDGTLTRLTRFGYSDFKHRLGEERR